MWSKKENRETNKNILALWKSWWDSKDHIAGEKPPNLITEDSGRKLITVEESKIVNEKLPDPKRVLGKKQTPYDWGLKKMKKSS